MRDRSRSASSCSTRSRMLAAIAGLSAFATAPRPSRETSTTSLSGLSKPMSARDTSFSTMRSRPLRSSLPRARSRPSGRSRPRSRRAPGPAGALRRSRRGCRSSPRARATTCPRARASRRAARRPVVGDGGGHQHDVGASAPRASDLALELGGRLDLDDPATRRPDARVRDDRDDLGATSRSLVGERRAHAPRAAVAEEAHRVERLARAAGGDEHAPPGEACRAGAAAIAIASAIAAGSAMRPMPHSPSASAPSSGPTSTAPRAASVATFARVAGCSHMRTFIAGATTSGPGRGQRALRHDVVGEAVRELRERVRRARRDAHERRDARRVEVRVRCRRAPAHRAAPGGG